MLAGLDFVRRFPFRRGAGGKLGREVHEASDFPRGFRRLLFRRLLQVDFYRQAFGAFVPLVDQDVQPAGRSQSLGPTQLHLGLQLGAQQYGEQAFTHGFFPRATELT